MYIEEEQIKKRDFIIFMKADKRWKRWHEK